MLPEVVIVHQRYVKIHQQVSTMTDIQRQSEYIPGAFLGGVPQYPWWARVSKSALYRNTKRCSV